MATAPVFKLARVSTASTWDNLWWSLWESAKRARGVVAAPDASRTWTPRITNREAIALVRAFRGVAARVGGWPLWYQFAAVAYGWTPANDVLKATAAQGERSYPVATAAELWSATQRIALASDGAEPRVELDPDAFADPVMQGDVSAALRHDGAAAGIVVGFGGCKGPDGKPAAPTRTCKVKNGMPVCTWECKHPAPIVVRNPFRAPGWLLVLVVGAWLAYGDDTQQRRRRRMY